VARLLALRCFGRARADAIDDRVGELAVVGDERDVRGVDERLIALADGADQDQLRR
jgi:hypothetical protein